MPLWQFIAIAVLVCGLLIFSGALLIYARVLSNRIGSTNGTLKRIEEALLATDRLSRHAPATAAEALQLPEISAKDGGLSGKVGGAGYLTLRDLKVISRGSRPNRKRTVAMSPESHEALYTSGELQSPPVSSAVSEDFLIASSESHEALHASGEIPSSQVNGAVSEDSFTASPEPQEALYTSGELQSSPVNSAVSKDCLEASPESHEALHVNSELQSSPVNGALSEDSLAASSESRDASNTSGELQDSPDSSPVEEDLAKKKKQNELMYLSIQRRRRRARTGY